MLQKFQAFPRNHDADGRRNRWSEFQAERTDRARLACSDLCPVSNIFAAAAAGFLILGFLAFPARGMMIVLRGDCGCNFTPAFVRSGADRGCYGQLIHRQLRPVARRLYPISIGSSVRVADFFHRVAIWNPAHWGDFVIGQFI